MRKGAPTSAGGRAEGLGHACGVFGVYAPGQLVANLTYLGLYALQHRGQESAGIACSDGETITVVKDMGLVTQVFDERRLAPLDGHLAIGHNRYSTTGSSTWRNAQPVYRSVGDAGFALGHNGNLTNTVVLADSLGMLPGLDRPRCRRRLDDGLRAGRRAGRAARTRPSRAPTGVISRWRSSRCSRASRVASRSCSWTRRTSSVCATGTASGRSCSGASRAAGCSRARPRPSTSSARTSSARSSPARWSSSTRRASASTASRIPTRSSASSSSCTSRGPTPTCSGTACTPPASAWGRSSRARLPSTPTW